MIRPSPGRTRSAAALSRRRGRTAPRLPVPRDDRLDGTGHPHLSPAGWKLGKPVRDFLTEGPLPTAEAVAVTLAVLSALGAVHRAGRVHGGVSEDGVGVAADGWVRLAAETAGDDRRGRDGDLRDTGVLLCRLLGVPPEPRAGQPSGQAERAAPALVAVARSLARGGGLWSAEEAWTAVKDAAGQCGSEPQLVRALAGLADRVEGATPIERAVTTIVVGPPLRAEPPPLPRGRPAFSLSLPRLRLPDLPVLPEAVAPRISTPKVSAPRLALPAMPRVPRPSGPQILFVASALLIVGLLVGGVAGARAALSRPRTAVAAPAAKPRNPSAPARPAGLYAATPTAAVTMFFQLVRDQKLDQAALLWKPKMAADVDLRSRFSGITAIDVRRADTVAEDDALGIATVEVDWVETHADGTTAEYIGEIYTDTGPVLWRWDSWHVREVAPDAAGGGNGSGNGDGG